MTAAAPTRRHDAPAGDAELERLSREVLLHLLRRFPWRPSVRDVLSAQWRAASDAVTAAFAVYVKASETVHPAYEACREARAAFDRHKTRKSLHALEAAEAAWRRAELASQGAFRRYEAADRKANRLWQQLEALNQAALDERSEP